MVDLADAGSTTQLRRGSRTELPISARYQYMQTSEAEIVCTKDSQAFLPRCVTVSVVTVIVPAVRRDPHEFNIDMEKIVAAQNKSISHNRKLTYNLALQRSQ